MSGISRERLAEIEERLGCADDSSKHYEQFDDMAEAIRRVLELADNSDPKIRDAIIDALEN